MWGDFYLKLLLCEERRREIFSVGTRVFVLCINGNLF